MAKRMRYVSDNYSSSENEIDDSESNQSQHTQRKNGKTKWLSKNAIMARENRLRKKLYLKNLENQVGQLQSDNDKFTKVIDKQSMLIGDMRKQIKYLKSVITNSGDIGNLIRNIQQSTGMSVRSSLDDSLSLNNVNYISKRKVQTPIARKTLHPWDDNDKLDTSNKEQEQPGYCNYPTPESCGFSADDLLIDETPLDFINLFEFDENCIDETNANPHLTEHNYTCSGNDSSTDSQPKIDEPDVGVCLHVSKSRVSLEFCSSCSENSSNLWK